jgi:phosphohistidine phosphatase SixA
MFWKYLSIFAALVCMPISWTSAASDQRYNFLELIERIKADVIFLRHASAPGFGDPEDFNLADCSTQRNLDDLGRVQAVNIGIELKSFGVEFDEILSSQWCRCKETAGLLDLGDWVEFVGLNSFFQNFSNKEETLALLNKKLLSKKTGVSLMVTHQVVIRAITGMVVSSGGVVVHNSKTGQSEIYRLDN